MEVNDWTQLSLNHENGDDSTPASFRNEVGEVDKLPEQPFQVQNPPEDRESEAEKSEEEHMDEMSDELRQGYRILCEIMAHANKAVNWLFMDPIEVAAPELSEDYHERISKPVWLKLMRKKFQGNEYESITEFVTDFRLMLENCYRFNGPDHYVSKRGQKLETMLEQKLVLLPRDLRSKTSITATSGAVDQGQVGLGLRRRPKQLVPHDSSALLNQLREAEAQRDREWRRQQILGRKAEKEALAQEIVEWEENVLFHGNLTRQMKAMWELPQIGLFLFLCQIPLNTGEVMQYELERCFLLPRESSTMKLVMTSLLSTPFQRSRINMKTLMSYKIWEEKLRSKLQQWYKVYTDCNCVAEATWLKLGLDPMFFDVVGKRNPLERKRFHELRYYQKVWIMKGLCDFCLHSQESLREAIEGNVFEDQREYLLGTDAAGQRYLHFPQFCGADVRIYRQAPIKYPKLEIKPDPVIKKRKFPPTTYPPKPAKILKEKKKKARKVKPPTPPPVQPQRSRPSRLRQTIKPVVPLQLEMEAEDTASMSDSPDNTEQDNTNTEEEEEEEEEETEEMEQEDAAEEDPSESGVESAVERLSTCSDTDTSSTIPYGERSETNSTFSSRDCSRESSPFVNSSDFGLRRSSRTRAQVRSRLKNMKPRASKNLSSSFLDDENSKSNDSGERGFSCDIKEESSESVSQAVGIVQASTSAHTEQDTETGGQYENTCNNENSRLLNVDMENTEPTFTMDSKSVCVQDTGRLSVSADLMMEGVEPESVPFRTGSLIPGELGVSGSGARHSDSDSDTSQGDRDSPSQLFTSSAQLAAVSATGTGSTAVGHELHVSSDTNSQEAGSHARLQPVLKLEASSGKPDNDDSNREMTVSAVDSDSNTEPAVKSVSVVQETAGLENNSDNDNDVEVPPGVTVAGGTELAAQGGHCAVAAGASCIPVNDLRELSVKLEEVTSTEAELVGITSAKPDADIAMNANTLNTDSSGPVVRVKTESGSADQDAVSDEGTQAAVGGWLGKDGAGSHWTGTLQVKEEGQEELATGTMSEASQSVVTVKQEGLNSGVTTDLTVENQGIKTDMKVDMSEETVTDIKTEISCNDGASGMTEKEEEVKSTAEDTDAKKDLDQVKAEEEEEEEGEEILPNLDDFELIVESVEELRNLASRFAEEEPVIIRRGKKEQITKPPPRKRCVTILHERLLFLLKELEPWEGKLVQARKRARLKLRKEREDYVESEEENGESWATDEETESGSSGSDDDGAQSGANTDTEKKNRKAAIPKLSKGQAAELTVKVEDPEDIDVSLRGRLRKRRIIPNNAEDQIAPKKTKTPVKIESVNPAHQPNILQKNVKLAPAVSGSQGQSLNAGRILLGCSEIIRQLKGGNTASSASASPGSGQILLQTMVGGQPVLTSLMPQTLQNMQNLKLLMPGQGGQLQQISVPASAAAAKPSQHPTIQHLLSKTGPVLSAGATAGEPAKPGTAQSQPRPLQPQPQTPHKVVPNLIVRPSTAVSQQTTPPKAQLVIQPAGTVLSTPQKTTPQKAQVILKPGQGPVQTPKGKVTYYAATVNSLPPAVVAQLLKTPGAKIQTGPNQQNVLLIPMPASCGASTVTTSSSPAVARLPVPSAVVKLRDGNQPKIPVRVPTASSVTPVKVSGSSIVPARVASTSLASSETDTGVARTVQQSVSQTSPSPKADNIPGIAIKPVITLPAHSPPPKYASNVTVKTLLEKRKSVEDKDRDKLSPQSAVSSTSQMPSLPVSPKDSVIHSQPVTTVTNLPGKTQVVKSITGTADGVTKSTPGVYTTISPAKLEHLLFQTNAAGARTIPSLIKLPSKAVLDSAVKAVVTSVSTTLPTVNIKVPSPTSLPSIGPRRNVTKTIQSMKSPIPVAPKLTSQTNSSTLLTVADSSLHMASTQPGAVSQVVSSSAGNLNMSLVKNLGAEAVLQNVDGKQLLTKIVPQTVLTSQGIMQGYMTPQGFVVPQTSQAAPAPAASQPATTLLAQMGLQTLIQQGAAGNQVGVQFCRDTSGRLQLVQTPSIVQQNAVPLSPAQPKVIPQPVQLKPGVQQQPGLIKGVGQVQLQGPGGKLLIVKQNTSSANMNSVNSSVTGTVGPTVVSVAGGPIGVSQSLKILPAAAVSHVQTGSLPAGLKSPSPVVVSTCRPIRPQANTVAATALKSPVPSVNTFVMPQSLTAAAAAAAVGGGAAVGTVHQATPATVAQPPASPVLNIPAGYMLQGGSNFQLASPMINQVPMNLLQPGVALQSPAGLLQQNVNLLPPAVKPLQPTVSPVQQLLSQQPIPSLQMVVSSAPMVSQAQPRLVQSGVQSNGQMLLSAGQMVTSGQAGLQQCPVAVTGGQLTAQVQMAMKEGQSTVLGQPIHVQQRGNAAAVDQVKRAILQTVSGGQIILKPSQQTPPVQVVNQAMNGVSTDGPTSASDLVKQLAAAQLQSKFVQSSVANKSIPDVKPVLLQQQLSSPPKSVAVKLATSASAASSMKHVMLQYVQTGKSPAHVELKSPASASTTKEVETLTLQPGTTGNSTLKLKPQTVTSASPAKAVVMNAKVLSGQVQAGKEQGQVVVVSAGDEHSSGFSVNQADTSITAVSPMTGELKTQDNVQIPGVSQQKLMLFSIGGQLVTGQGVPVTFNNGVLKLMPKAKVQIANQTLTPKQIQQTLAKIGQATIPALNLTAQQQGKGSATSEDSTSVIPDSASNIGVAVPAELPAVTQVQLVAESNQSAVFGASEADKGTVTARVMQPGTPALAPSTQTVKKTTDSFTSDSHVVETSQASGVVRGGTGNVQFVLKPMVYSTGYIVCPRISGQTSPAGLSSPQTGAMGMTSKQSIMRSVQVPTISGSGSDSTNLVTSNTVCKSTSRTADRGDNLFTKGDNPSSSSLSVGLELPVNQLNTERDNVARITIQNSRPTTEPTGELQEQGAVHGSRVDVNMVSEKEAALNLLTLANQHFEDEPGNLVIAETESGSSVADASSVKS